MTISAVLAARNNLSCIGAHASLVAATVGLLFLQRYIWLLKLSEQGYGPYESASYLIAVSIIIIVVDFCAIILTLNRPRLDKIVSMGVPALFLFVAIFIFIANNA